MADEDAPAPNDAQADRTEQETIAGLWSALLRYVPKGEKRIEARALANVLDFLLRNEAADARRQAVNEAFDRGLKIGEGRGRMEASLAYQRLALDEHGIVLNPQDIEDKAKITH